MNRQRQTVIPASSEAEQSFDSFYPGANAELVAALQQLTATESTDATRRRVLYLWGEPGSGKTHLLHACCQLARVQRRPFLYLPVTDIAPDRRRLDAAPPDAVVCVDDFQVAAGSSTAAGDWQAALFQLYEKLQGGVMVVAATRPAGEVDLALKDLQSRLVSGGVFKLSPLTETGQLTALNLRARQLGFELNDQVLQYIITYYQRDTASLFALLERIDSASLAEQRKITVPFIRALLQQSLW